MIKFSDVKKYIKDKDLRSKPEIKDALIRAVTSILDKASEKTIRDKRKTVVAEDILSVNIGA